MEGEADPAAARLFSVKLLSLVGRLLPCSDIEKVMCSAGLLRGQRCWTAR